jgi:glycine/D-amino acid oxidase-like deaminating enzyme
MSERNYDWIVVGAGITGAALGYELAKAGGRVLLLEQNAIPHSATRFSYGGLAYWSGTTELTRRLFAEGLALHRELSDELDASTQFRELDLLLTLGPQEDLDALLSSFQPMAIQPQVLTPEQAQQREPQINPGALAACLQLPHAQIHPQRTVTAYLEAMARLGGQYHVDTVRSLLRSPEGRVVGVMGESDHYGAAQVVICAGALTRSLLHTSGLGIALYFTHAEILETAPQREIHLGTIVMQADSQRFALEAQATRPEVESLWDEGGHQLAPAILDAGAVQLTDGQIRIGQISRTLTDFNAPIDRGESEATMRGAIQAVLPNIAPLPATWQRTWVSFSRDRLPLIGPVGVGLWVFSGFSNPMAIVPLLARKFAGHHYGQPDADIVALSPQRFATPSTEAL